MPASQNVVPIHPFDDGAALAWLQAKGTVQISAAALGRQFGWSRQKASRRLQVWADARQIKRHGKVIVAIPPKTGSLSVQMSGAVPVPPSTNVRKSAQRGVTRILLSLLLFLIGTSISSVLVAVNVTSWASFAKASQSWYIQSAFVALGATVAITVIALPAAARVATRGTATTLWAIWAFVFMVDVLTSVGFSYGNFGTAVAGTEAGVNRRAFLEKRIHSLLKERQAMPDVLTTTREMAEAATKARERACAAAAYCKAAEAKEALALKDWGMAKRAEEIKGELQTAEGELASIQVVASADPLTEGIVDLAYQTTGHKLEARSVTTGRNIIFALFLLVPAGVFRGAISLVRD